MKSPWLHVQMQILKAKIDLMSDCEKCCNLSVIRQKSKSQNECYNKAKHAKFCEKRTFLTPDKHTYVWVSGDKECSFFGKYGLLCFLVTLTLHDTKSLSWDLVKQGIMVIQYLDFSIYFSNKHLLLSMKYKTNGNT